MLETRSACRASQMSVHRLYTEYAALYDAAFDWDVSGQVASICGLSGLTRGRVLEPMCGSGRLARGFAAAGFATVGVDNSREMLALAAQRYAQAGLSGEWIEADATDFDLDEGCHLAICPINSLAHLPSAAAMQSHLNAVARNLYTGSQLLDSARPQATGYAGRGRSVGVRLSRRDAALRMALPRLRRRIRNAPLALRVSGWPQRRGNASR